ncbi:pirin family protein [Galbibacter pacificus]|uniref:Pirin family protein n=1 Tax=Galbibacter pacificus TaxID=2996052 RepID=A0ABT6FRC5_9FLAO|nr:pirin family protein [Galbibacter pacificus]MDG3581717.1 pirin family protein [Galbibacter pacificus]MDG3585809.1 pirin family protein [Galbibacter pacificus]
MYLDPFLFLNHHGLQEYGKNNNGLPFGPHPHRGFETVTFILEGDIKHKDSNGYESTITAGGVQWMTAGKGLIHEEVSSDKFKEQGGNLEILQLWVNLPAKYKMVEPKYIGVQKEGIPKLDNKDKTVVINAVSGMWKDTKGGIDTLTDIALATIEIKKNATYSLTIPKVNNIFFM